MNPLFITTLVEIGGKLIDKVFPNEEAKTEAKLKLLEMQQKGELAQLDAEVKLKLEQIEVNKAEANSTDAYRAGWRPTIGYVLAFALAFQYIFNPLLIWANAIFGWNINPPVIGVDDKLFELMFGMLGLAGIRTYEKIKTK